MRPDFNIFISLQIPLKSTEKLGRQGREKDWGRTKE